jgi:uncharacterized alpha-E superfamily protein
VLLSRLAERVYWLGRYLERSEDLARAILAHTKMSLDMPESAEVAFKPLLEICGVATQLTGSSPSSRGLLPILRALVMEGGETSSLLALVTSARENARVCRAFIPEDVWDTLNPAYLSLVDLNQRASIPKIEQAIQGVIRACQQIHTQLAESMSRDEAFLFVQLGRYIERADMLLRVTQVSEALGRVNNQDAPFADVRWMSMLHSQNAYQMYRREHEGHADIASTLRFLLGSQKFPRSLWFSLSEVSSFLDQLPMSRDLVEECEALRAFALPCKPTEPRVYAEGLLMGLSALSDSLHTTYFAN